MYLLRDVNGVNRWKIGYTTKEDPKYRVKELERQNGTQLELKKCWKVINCRNTERMLHKLLPGLDITKTPKENTNGSSGKRINGRTEYFDAAENDIIDKADSLMEEVELRGWTIIISKH